MGNRTSQYLQEGLELLPLFASHKTDRLLATLINLRRLFFSQIAVLAIEGFLIGYYAVTVTLMFRKNLEEERGKSRQNVLFARRHPSRSSANDVGKYLVAENVLQKWRNVRSAARRWETRLLRSIWHDFMFV